MTSPHRLVKNEISDAIKALVETGLADDQNFPHESQIARDVFRIQHSNGRSLQTLLRNRPYQETYNYFRSERSFNVLMLDGAMLQLYYEFQGDTLRSHRLAFLPSPDLLEYQNNPELYLEEQMYADVVHRDAVTVPLRFDYDNSAGSPKPIDHPTSHLTLGQYRECRIPVSSGVTPHSFFDFILRSFYNSASASVNIRLSQPKLRFDESIYVEERNLVHVSIPTST